MPRAQVRYSTGSGLARPAPPVVVLDKPTYSNTGARSALRTDLPVLTPTSSPVTWTNGSPGSPFIVRDKDFDGGIDTASISWVTFINCRLRNDSTTDQVIRALGTGVVFQDCTIAPTTPIGKDGMMVSGVTLTRTLIYNTADGIKNGGTPMVLDSCLIDGRPTGDAVGAAHGDNFQVTDGPMSGVAITNTVFYGGNDACLFLDAADGNGVAFTAWVVDGCWFYGGPAAGSAWSTSFAIAGKYTAISVTGCRFQRGAGLDNIASDDIAPAWAAWSGNVWDDDGTPVPPP